MLLLVGAESYCFQDPEGTWNRGRIDEDELEHKRGVGNLTVSWDGQQLIETESF
jgi:hypothetical protein